LGHTVVKLYDEEVAVGWNSREASFIFPVEFLSALNVFDMANDSSFLIAEEFLNQVRVVSHIFENFQTFHDFTHIIGLLQVPTLEQQLELLWFQLKD